MEVEPFSQLKTDEEIEETFNSWCDGYMDDLDKKYENYKNTLSSLRKMESDLVSLCKSGKNMMKKFDLKLKLHSRESENYTIGNSNLSTIRRKLYSAKTLNYEVDKILPKPPRWFLKLCVGNLNVSLNLNKYQYKDEYENFKLKATLIILFLWIFNWIFLRLRIFDSISQGFIMWYFSTLIIRESILVNNGSRIKLWWRIHHVLSVFAAGLMLMWPQDDSYKQCRNIHYLVGFFQCIIQLSQYHYQKTQLYKIQSMGTAVRMEITEEGPTKRMWVGLSLISVILFIHYLAQLYLALSIFRVFKVTGGWQLFILMSLNAIFSVGNMITLASLLIEKYKESERIKRNFPRSFMN